MLFEIAVPVRPVPPFAEIVPEFVTLRSVSARMPNVPLNVLPVAVIDPVLMKGEMVPMELTLKPTAWLALVPLTVAVPALTVILPSLRPSTFGLFTPIMTALVLVEVAEIKPVLLFVRVSVKPVLVLIPLKTP